MPTQFSSVPLLPSSYPGRLASRNSTQFFTSLFDYCSVLLQLRAPKLDSPTTTSHGSYGKHSLYYLRSLFNAPLPSNRHPIIACLYVAGMCLSIRCLAMDIHFAILTICENPISHSDLRGLVHLPQIFHSENGGTLQLLWVSRCIAVT
jgi:hypothetical protein